MRGKNDGASVSSSAFPPCKATLQRKWREVKLKAGDYALGGNSSSSSCSSGICLELDADFAVEQLYAAGEVPDQLRIFPAPEDVPDRPQGTTHLNGSGVFVSELLLPILLR